MDDGDHAVSRDGSIDLDTDGILRITPELLDVEMLFHPFKELMQILISSLKYLNFHYICTCETSVSETTVS